MEKEIADKVSIKRFISNIFWALKFSFSIHPLLQSITTIFKIFNKITPIIWSYLYSEIITKITLAVADHLSFEILFNNIFELLLALLVLSMIQSILGLIDFFTGNYLDNKRSREYDKKYFTKLAELNISQFEDNDIADKIRRWQDNIWKVENTSRKIIEYIAQLIAGITSVVIVLRFEPLIIVIAVILIIPQVIADTLRNKSIRNLYDTTVELWREYWDGKFYLEDRNSVKEFRILGITNKIFKNVVRIREKFDNEYMKRMLKYLPVDVVALSINLFDISGIILIIRKVLNTTNSLGDITFYYSQLGRISQFINVLIRDLVYLYDQSRYLEHVRALLDLQPAMSIGTKKIKMRTPPIIEFKNVSFKYPKSKKYALKNISLKILPGEELAIVGENGAGKSTLIKLLLRFYDVTEGQVLINGINIKDIDLDNYYSNIGALFQDYWTIAYLSLEENIKYAKSKFTNSTHLDAAKLADVHKDIIILDKGYKHKNSPQYENGIELSQGQKQKLIIARAFYRNAPILILDEPTASIDAVAEYNIFKRIYKFMTDKTVIIISHRFSTVKNAQRIIVFNKGRIVEEGSHSELLKQNGRYANAYKLQAEGYENK